MANRNEITTTLSGVHLCCGGCTDAADTALRSVPGVTSLCDIDNSALTFTAPDHAAARDALSALAGAGFYGESDTPGLAVPPVGEVPSGVVSRATVSGIHNCCDLCADAIKQAVATVDGVSGDTAAPKVTRFEVTGSFRPDALVKALNAAGFSARVSV